MWRIRNDFASHVVAIGIGLAACLAPGFTDAATNVSIPGTVLRSLTSRVNGMTYQLFISLPPDYDRTNRKYPTFYVLDGNLVFGLLTDAVRPLRFENTIPDMIVVGVGYPEDSPAVYSTRYVENRLRDYTSADGAPKFLKFMEDELLPFMERNYRVDPIARGLGGASAGAAFTAYVLLERPELFAEYFMQSGRPPRWLEQHEEGKAGRSAAKKVRVFTTVGELEPEAFRAEWNRFNDRLRSISSIELEAVVMTGETHASLAAGGAVNNGLRWLFRRRTVALDEAARRVYAGKWRLSDGKVLTILSESDKLFLVRGGPSGANRSELFAQSETVLFTKDGPFEFEFTSDGNDHPTRVVQRQYGESEMEGSRMQ